MTRREGVAVGGVAVLVVTGVASCLAVAAGEPASVFGLPLAGALAAAVVGGSLIRLLQRRSLRVLVLATGLTATGAVVAGVGVTAHAMFISEHDLAIIGPILLTSSVVAVSAAFWLGDAFERSVARVGAMARALASVGAPLPPPPPVLTSELAGLAAAIQVAAAHLAASRERERALEDARRELVAWVSHDLRSPIASIRAMAEALEDGIVADPQDVASYHRSLRQESERLGHLVDDLFELARISGDGIDADQPLVPLPELVSEVADSFAPRARGGGITLVGPAGEVPDVLVPASDLRRVLHNLLDNALRHTPPGGTVRLDCGPGPTLAVTDGCGGIPTADLPHVFEVAFRGDTARGRDAAGGGLGLAIVRGLVEAHGGSVTVANVGGGCRFAVDLPVGGGRVGGPPVGGGRVGGPASSQAQARMSGGT